MILDQFRIFPAIKIATHYEMNVCFSFEHAQQKRICTLVAFFSSSRHKSGASMCVSFWMSVLPTLALYNNAA